MMESTVPLIPRDMLSRAVGWVCLLTGFNAIVCVLHYELGFGPMTFLFGPGDRFADLIKFGLSFKSVVGPHLADGQLAAWPEIFRSYYLNNPYTETIQPGLDVLSNLHSPPLGQVIAVSAGLLTVVLPSPAWTLVLFFLAYVGVGVGAVGLAIPRSERTATAVTASAIALLLSYPALMVFTRGNIFSGVTSLCIIGFCLSVYRRRSVDAWAILSLAVAINLRPNAAIFALAIPLQLGVRASIPHLLRAGLAAGLVFSGSLGIAHWLNPASGLQSFLAALRIYWALYVEGSGGDSFSSSLLPLLKAVSGGRAPVSVLILILDAIGVALIALSAIAALSGRLRSSAVCFLLAACYALVTPVFGDYHLLVFLAPLLLLQLEAEAGPVQWDAIATASAVASVLLLSAKNLGTWQGHSLQVFMNPLVTLGAMAVIFRNGIRRGSLPAQVEA